MNEFMRLIAFYSYIYNVDPVLVKSVIAVESQFRTDAVGSHGEVGLMQLRPEYFPIPREELLKPNFNIRHGVKYLSEVKKYCKHNRGFEWIVCYNAGVTGGSKIQYPKLHPYYKKIAAEYYQRGK